MTRPLWTFDAFLAATGGRVVGTPPPAVAGISIDSRTIAPGEAFFAIRGEALDGHDFVPMAQARDAATTVVAENRVAEFDAAKGPLTIVGDVLAALGSLGVAARNRTAARIAAVTGSVGKTSTKEMLAATLAPDGPVHYSPASFNNQWGVPLTLARMPQASRYGVFEIGMNHAGEIEPLVKMVRPHVAIVTTVEPVHLEFFKNVEGIARAKAEIFFGVEPGGTAILNRDNPHHALLARLARDVGVELVIGFGDHADAEARLIKVKLAETCSCIWARILGEDVQYKLGAPGRHLVQNSLAVLAAVATLGGDLARAALALATLAPPKGRGQRHRLAVRSGAATLIDESYNANPASMRAALALLGQAEPGRGGRRIAILGDMRELGPEAPAMHAALGELIAAAAVDRVYLAGPLMELLWRTLPAKQRGAHAEKATELEALLVEAIAPGDVLMVKGSYASRMGPLVDALKVRFAPGAGAVDTAQEQETA